MILITWRQWEAKQKRPSTFIFIIPQLLKELQENRKQQLKFFFYFFYFYKI